VLFVVACEREGIPPLVEVSEVSPRQIEVGDRLELRGAGFPQGRVARVTFRGTLRRPGRAPVTGASVEAEGVVTGSDHIEVVVSEPLEERFCGHGDVAVHTTMTGDLEVAFTSSTPGAPPLVGVMHGLTLDVTPSSVPPRVAEARSTEGARLLAFLGITPGVATPRGIPIDKLAPGSPGDAAGLLSGDLISAVDGVHVREIADIAPASARSALFTVRHGDSGIEETKTISMIGYAGARIPHEYAPALLVVGLALAALLLLALPAPTIASALELRVARRLRKGGMKAAMLALVGRGPRAIGSALASVLVGTFALGPWVVGADLDGAVLLVTAIALFLAARLSAAGGLRAAARVAGEVGLAGLVLTLSMAGVVIHGGALHLTEIVRAQGGAPWEVAALRHPVLGVLALATMGSLFALLRARDGVASLVHARVEAGEIEQMPEKQGARATNKEDNGRLLLPPPPQDLVALRASRYGLLERLGLVVASALAVAVFFGGWQLPGGIEARTTILQAAAALLFVAKTWGLAGMLLGASSIASPWTSSEARAFVLRRLLPALVLGAALLALSRKLGPSESLSAAVSASLVTALALLTLRTVLRIRGAMQRPEPHASPFL
jgi:NADH-quinone oxidoreductase subunit H